MFENKKIFILGFARSGYESAKLLAKRGNQVVLNDMKEDHDETQIKELQELGVKLILGEHPDNILDHTFDYLIKNPGVPIHHKYIIQALELGIEVINEMELAYCLLPCDVTIVGITGTNGKTTTATIIYEMIKESGKNVHLAGNIGYPLCGFLDKLQKDDIIVAEISSQQLENVKTLKPHIAVMMNLEKAHLDFFESYDYYKKIKSKIFQNQTKKDIAILNIEDKDIMDVTKNMKSTVKYFSSQNSINGCYMSDDAIYYYDERIIGLKDIKLIGKHNYENIMASIMVVKELGVDNDSIIKVLNTFQGVEHRLEFVKEFHERYFYNDSKSTNIKSTQIALSSFEHPTILILGGMERGQNFYDLKDYMSFVKLIVCYGENKDKIKQFGDDLMIETLVFDCLEEAVFKAYELSSPKDIILFSPASASWDQYQCFEERGLEYKNYVERLGENSENN